MKKILALALLALGLSAGAQTTGYQVGDIIKDFRLKNVDSKMVSLKDYKDSKGFMLVFTCNTCPVSRAYAERIIALNNKYAPKGYPMIAVNPNDPEAQPGDSFEKMQSYARQKGFQFPYLYDPGQVITRQFGASRTPHMFVLKRTNKGIIVEYIGAIDDDAEDSGAGKTNFAQNAVDALIAGQKPPVTFTKAVGCTIKWKKTQG